jgi:hypothetical protein
MTVLRFVCLSLAVACGNAQPPPPAAKAPVGPSDLRIIDRRILPLVQQPVTTLARDVFPQETYAVTLQPDPTGSYCRVVVDLDRDRQPDEIWIVDAPDRISRMISTADDGVNYDVTLTLRNGVWAADLPPPE